MLKIVFIFYSYRFYNNFLKIKIFALRPAVKSYLQLAKSKHFDFLQALLQTIKKYLQSV